MTMREKIAQAIDGADKHSVGFTERAVQAVLEAMREPTEAMVLEGAYQIPCGQGEEEGPLNNGDTQRCWTAMIDAALLTQEAEG